MLTHYLKIAFRNLWKYKIQNLIGILGLAVGIIVFSICSFLVQYMLVRDQYPGHKRIYEIRTQNYSSVQGDVKNILTQFTSIEKVTSQWHPSYNYGTTSINGKETIMPYKLQEMDSSVISFFSLKILFGDKQTILNTPNSILLYESEALKHGKLSLLPGTHVLIENESYTITGILKDLPRNSNIFSATVGGLLMNKTGGFYQQVQSEWDIKKGERIYFMLKDNIPAKEFQKQLDNYNFNIKQDNPDITDHVFMKQINEIETEQIVVSIGMFIIGLLVLLTALFNYISFQTALFYNRRKEGAIRKVNGSGRWQQQLLFYTEVVVVLLISGLVGLVLFEILIPFIEASKFHLIIGDIQVTSGIRIQVLQSVVIGLIIAFLLCIIPSNNIYRSSIQSVIFGISKKGRKGNARKILLFVQFIILLLFMSSTLVVKLQTRNVTEKLFNTLPEEEQQNITIFAYDDGLIPVKSEVIINKLQASQYIQNISFSNLPVTNYGYLTNINMNIPGHENESARKYSVDTNFCDFFEVKMIRGEFLNENSPPNAAVVDETFASLFPDDNPIGLSFENQIIIGVIENIQVVKENDEFTQKKNPVFYTLANKDQWGYIYIKAFPGKSNEAVTHLKQCIYEFVPESISLYIVNFHEEIENVFEVENVMSMFATVFFIISLIINLLSIFSAIAMSAEKRRKEVAIRKINGASIKDIILLFSKSYIRLWTIVCLLLFPIVYYVGNQWLMTFNQRISLDVFFFLSIYLSILLLIISTIIFQILKVAKCNPAEVIKSE